MSDVTGPPGSYKTIGVRLNNGLHSQVTMMAKLDGLSLQDALVRGAALYVEKKQAEPDFKDRVAAELKKIEQEAADRRGAIESLFGSDTQANEARVSDGDTAPEADATDDAEATPTKTTTRSPRAKS
ncbi:hypothetical protein OG394_14210 [Kribbella sp. NBC_01245]|uniref:hypothetical protein n=1 Tax=Kribbella sp. NBC_01245 TaxID=2903578 RepID=UPI002E2BDF99|nr:hypothetical protein [Kribbella sp. NBC_01245]